MKNGLRQMVWIAVFGALALAGGGCGSPPASTGTLTPTTTTAATPTGGGSSNDIPDLSKTVEAGVPVKVSSDPKMIAAVINTAATKYGPPRSDPFALKPAERQFDVDQETERVFGETGGWENRFTPSNPFGDQIPAPIETQPYRRLAGVVVGDSIVALIDMGDRTFIIYPGEQLPEPYSEWTVKSIDMDQAVLERKSGNPRQVVVRLELPPGGGVGAPPMGGGPPGMPGGPPGAGRPGMRGGFGNAGG